MIYFPGHRGLAYLNCQGQYICNIFAQMAKKALQLNPTWLQKIIELLHQV